MGVGYDTVNKNVIDMCGKLELGILHVVHHTNQQGLSHPHTCTSMKEVPGSGQI